jgi:hypothetical protein
MQPEYIRRNLDGSTDYDFYRRRAARLRMAKIRDSVRAAASLARPLIAVALLVGTLLAMPTRSPETSSSSANVEAAELILALTGSAPAQATLRLR